MFLEKLLAKDMVYVMPIGDEGGKKSFELKWVAYHQALDLLILFYKK